METMKHIIVSLCLLLTLWPSFARISLLELKDTFNALKEEYKQLTPFQGAIWADKQCARHLYYLGDQNDATIKLINDKDLGLFFDNPAGGFQVKGTDLVKALSPSGIGTIIGLLQGCKTTDELDALRNKISKKLDSQLKEKIFGKSSEKKIKPLLLLIIDSYKECFPGNVNARYLPYTTFIILQNVLWEKVQSKQDIIDYFEAIEKEINNTIFTESAPQVDTAYDRKEIKSFSIDTINSSSSPADLDPQFELIALKIILSKPLAPIAQGRPKYKEYEFPDCGETSLINFFNYMLYNPVAGQFDVSRLKEDASSELVKFYKEFSTHADIDTAKAHNAWAQIMSEIPGVIYGSGGVCNISGCGNQQILKISQHLIPTINNFDELAAYFSRNNFKVTYESKCDKNGYGTDIFYVNDEEVLKWIYKVGHFFVDYSKQNPPTSLGEIIKGRSPLFLDSPFAYLIANSLSDFIQITDRSWLPKSLLNLNYYCNLCNLTQNDINKLIEFSYKNTIRIKQWIDNMAIHEQVIQGFVNLYRRMWYLITNKSVMEEPFSLLPYNKQLTIIYDNRENFQQEPKSILTEVFTIDRLKNASNLDQLEFIKQLPRLLNKNDARNLIIIPLLNQTHDAKQYMNILITWTERDSSFIPFALTILSSNVNSEIINYIMKINDWIYSVIRYKSSDLKNLIQPITKIVSEQFLWLQKENYNPIILIDMLSEINTFSKYFKATNTVEDGRSDITHYVKMLVRLFEEKMIDNPDLQNAIEKYLSKLFTSTQQTLLYIYPELREPFTELGNSIEQLKAKERPEGEIIP